MDSIIGSSLQDAYGVALNRYSRKLLSDIDAIVTSDEEQWVKEREISSLIWCKFGGSSREADRVTQTILRTVARNEPSLN